MTENKKRISIGISDYADLISNNCYFVDKTHLIKSVFLEDANKVLIITRPRRFGKTLTMSMFSHFLSITQTDPLNKSIKENLFKDKEIYKDHQFCKNYLGKFPVIFISLKSVEGVSFEEAYGELALVIKNLASDLKYLLLSDALDNFEKAELDSLMNENLLTCNNVNVLKVKNSLKLLSKLLFKHHKKKSIILIDEYDVPLAKASVYGYYEQMIPLIRGLLQVLKDNDTYLQKAVITGCLRVAKESIFTGVNNLNVNSVISNNEKLNTAIGFTKDETVKLLQYFVLEQFKDTVKQWYDGYNFYNQEMFCAWDVISFVESALNCGSLDKVIPKNYWANTSSNDIIKEFLGFISPSDSDDMQTLLDGGVVKKNIRETINYDDIEEHNSDDFFTMLLYTGYLTVAKDSSFDTNKPIELKIPNYGVKKCFEHNIFDYFTKSKKAKATSKEILDAIFAKDADLLGSVLNTTLASYISVRDISTSATKEFYYHGFLNGYFSALGNFILNYQSNAEAGDGYADITFTSTDVRTGVVIEIKHVNKLEDMASGAKQGLLQIEKKNYQSLFTIRCSITRTILAYSICFCGKHCEVCFKEITNKP